MDVVLLSYIRSRGEGGGSLGHTLFLYTEAVGPRECIFLKSARIFTLDYFDFKTLICYPLLSLPWLSLTVPTVTDRTPSPSMILMSEFT